MLPEPVLGARISVPWSCGALRPSMIGRYSSAVLSLQRTDSVSVESPSTWLIAPSNPTRSERR